MDESISEMLGKYLTPEGVKKLSKLSDYQKKQVIGLLTSGEQKTDFSYLLSGVNVVRDFIHQGEDLLCKAQEFAEKGDDREKEIITKMIEKANTPIRERMFREKNLQEISELWSSADEEFIKIFKQLPNEDEKKKSFRRWIHRDLLEPYTSNIMIFCEEMRNISKFTGNHTTNTSNIQVYFDEMVSKLLNQTKVVDLDINYAPLFDNYEKYAAFIKLANNKHSHLYHHIDGLEKDDISEILSYGFWPQETKVLLKGN